MSDNGAALVSSPSCPAADSEAKPDAIPNRTTDPTSKKKKNSKYLLKSPTEDNSSGSEDEAKSNDDSAADDTSQVKSSVQLRWPHFSQVKDMLDFRVRSEVLEQKSHLPLLLYLASDAVSGSTVATVAYMLQVFHENECKLYGCFRETKGLTDPTVQSLLQNRAELRDEILKEFGWQPCLSAGKTAGKNGKDRHGRRTSSSNGRKHGRRTSAISSSDSSSGED